MSKPSNWPLDESSTRLVAPVVIREKLKDHPLASDCYPLAVGHYSVAHQHQMLRVKNDDNILILCVAGRGWLETPQWSGEVRGGDIALIASGVPHQYHADNEEPWTIFWCHFSGERARDHLENMDYQADQPVQQIGVQPVVQTQFRELISIASGGYNLKLMVHAANSLKQLLTQIGVLIYETDNQKSRQFEVDHIQKFMLQNLDKSLTLQELANLSALSKYHFSKRYQEKTGFSPIKHFLQMKMEYARYLLETSELHIYEVGLRVGFEDSLYFSRAFKAATNTSPKRYREMHRSNR